MFGFNTPITAFVMTMFGFASLNRLGCRFTIIGIYSYKEVFYRSCSTIRFSNDSTSIGKSGKDMAVR